MSFFRYIIAELKNNRRFSLLFIVNLTLGLSGFLAMDAFKVSLDETLKARSKAALGADLVVSARRPVSDKEIELVHELSDSDIESARFIELYSMVAANERSRLMQLKAIDRTFPFYGEIKLEEENELSSSDLHNLNHVWVYPEVLLQLGIDKGEALKIGETEFAVAGVIEDDAAGSLTTNMAPRIYLSLENLGQTNLLKPGSIAWYSVVFRLPTYSRSELNSFRDSVFKALDAPDARVSTHEDASEQLGRLLSYLNDFLSLTALAALFLAAVGCSFLFRSYMSAKMKEVAILLTLGMTHTQALFLYSAQLAVLGVISAVGATLLAYGILPILRELTSSLVPFDIFLQFDIRAIIIGFAIGLLSPFLIGLPLLIQIRNTKPQSLLSTWTGGKSRRLTGVVASLPALAALLGLSIWQANSVKTGSLFVLLLLASAAVLGIAVWALLFALNRFLHVGPHYFRYAVRDLSRLRLSTAIGFVSLGLGVVLMNLIPQVQSSLNQELQSPEKSKLPSLFMFDIQDEQVAPLKSLLETAQTTPDQISPMIRARLSAVNDKPFDKGKGATGTLTREQEREMRFRNRGFNLSYREQFIEGEEIIEGIPFTGRYDSNSDKLPEISVEKRFAERLGFEMGDTLTFDIQGIAIKGQVINFRKVKWTSFQPNFFIQFQPGVLEDAPKTYLATVPYLPLEKKNDLQNAVVEKLPNISIIDVSRLVERIRSIIQHMSWALQAMAVLCLLAGLIVIYSIANHHAQTRRWEVGLMKSLGATFSDIRRQFIIQFALLSLLAGFLGVAVSMLLSLTLSSILFDGVWVMDFTTPLISLVTTVILTIAVAYLATNSALKIKPRQLLT